MLILGLKMGMTDAQAADTVEVSEDFVKKDPKETEEIIQGMSKERRSSD